MLRPYNIILALAIVLGQPGGQLRKVTVIFEIPPQLQFYVPVTSNDIEERAFKVIYLRTDSQIAEAIALIQGTKEVFDPKEIRLKIKDGDNSYIFDATGIGLSSSGKAVKIDLKKLAVVLCR